MGWLSPRRALCGGEVLLTSVPFGVERKNFFTKKLAAQELEPFQVMKAFKEWFIWKWWRPECSIQGPLSHWDAVTADLRSDDGGAGGGLSTAPTLRLSRWHRRRGEELSTLSRRLADSSSSPWSDRASRAPSATSTVQSQFLLWRQRILELSYRRKGRPFTCLRVFLWRRLVSPMYWYHTNNNTNITWRR